MIEKIGLQQITPKMMTGTVSEGKPGATEITKQFGEFLQEALGEVSAQKEEANVLTQQFISGDISDVHNVMIAAEKASVGLALTVEIRNKVVEAYQEIMRMQI